MRLPPNVNGNKLHFYHLRYKTADGSTDNRGGLTIAYRSTKDDTGIEVAYARCHPNDNYCKAIGRNIAIGNLNWNRCWVLPRPETSNDFDTTKAAILRTIAAKLQTTIHYHSHELSDTLH